MDDEVALLGVKIKTLTEDYLRPEMVEGVKPFGERLTNAEILFLLGDYSQASLVLFDLVNAPYNRGHAMYGRALYYLAESLYQIGNKESARTYFEQVLHLSEAEHKEDALRRLIQIGDDAGNWDGIDEKVEALRHGGTLPPDIAYIHAKSLLRQKKYKEAQAAALEVPAGHRLYAKASYLKAVAELALGDAGGAEHDFDAVLAQKDNVEDVKDVQELAAMARGRIMLDEGRIADAVDAYQFIGRHSSRFEEALYEMTWTYVRAANMAAHERERDIEFHKAERALEVLLMSETETTLAPEAHLLLGNIQLKLRRYDDATSTFDQVIERYAPVRDELQQLAGKVDDPLRYYDEVTSRAKQGDGLLPPLALRWAAGGDKLQRAMAVVASLDEGQRWLGDAKAIIDKLEVVLASGRRTDLFPSLREAMARHLELYNALTALTAQLLRMERRTLEPHLTKDEAEHLHAVLAERERLEPAYVRLPQTRSELEARLSVREQRLVDLQRAAYKLRYPVRSMQAEIDATREWVRNNAARLRPQEIHSFRDRVAQAQREVDELSRQLAKLEGDIARERSVAGVVSTAPSHEEKLRHDYGATLDAEQEILAAAASRLGQDEQAALAAIEQRRLVVAGYYAELVRFQDRLDELVAEKAEQLKDAVTKEAQAIEEYSQAINKTREEAKLVVGEIAAAELHGVEKRFADIVLRADVGIIDVAWALKEERTHEISRRVNDQRRELQMLDAEFQEVLED